MGIGKIITGLRRDKVISIYSEKGRLIPHKIYCELRKVKACQKCGRKKSKVGKLQIHHILPLSQGGSNQRKNLRVLCRDCHKVEDKKALK